MAESANDIEGLATNAGNQPETVTSKSGRNVHVVLPLRGNSIVTACGIDRESAASCRAARTADASIRASTMYISPVNWSHQGRPGWLGARPSRLLEGFATSAGCAHPRGESLGCGPRPRWPRSNDTGRVACDVDLQAMTILRFEQREPRNREGCPPELRIPMLPSGHEPISMERGNLAFLFANRSSSVPRAACAGAAGTRPGHVAGCGRDWFDDLTGVGKDC